MKYVEEIKNQLHSFVSAFATAVDERTPYNGSHTRKVTAYASILADYMNVLHKEGKCEDYFDDNRKEQLELAAALHDIGKLIVPKTVMNKASRLGPHLEKIEDRFMLLEAYYDIDVLKGKLSLEDGTAKKQYLQESLMFIKENDKAGFMPNEKLERIADIGAQVYQKESGEEIAYLTEYEKSCLSIVRGTLTDEEREIMESHVVMTGKILDKVHFNSHYENVKKYAASHHEFLNGTGYPNHLKEDDLELETRILTVVDIYDALTCTDRPYKQPMPKEKAFAILNSMVTEGKLEGRLVQFLEEALKNVDMKYIEEWTF
jgi:HD-GYP domain-containing protein (c-di-GMP phosphodiesterase class II)